MSNVIAFLESLGKNPALAEAANEDYAAAVDALGLDDAPRQALLARDANALSDLLGGRSTMVCALFPADDQPQKEQEDEPQEDSPDETKESIGQRSLH